MGKNKIDVNNIPLGSAMWISEMKKGNSKLIADLYRRYKSDFVMWLQYQTSCDKDFAVDVFQDSIVALYENIKKEKITVIEQSVKDYLFGIGKKMYYLHLRNNQIQHLKTVSLEDNKLNLSDMEIKSVPNQKDEKNNMLTLLLKMKDPCKSILYLYYYKEMKIKEVATRLKYKSENVVRVQKARCMSALRKAYYKYNEK